MRASFDRYAAMLSSLLRSLADKLEQAAPGHPRAVTAGWVSTIKPGEEVHVPMGEISVSNEDKPTLTATVTFTDAAGNPTTADDIPTWTSSDDTIAAVSPSPDGLSGTVTVTSVMGSAVITVHTVNEDGSKVDASGTVHVMAGDAVMGSVEFTQAETPAAEAPPAEASTEG